MIYLLFFQLFCMEEYHEYPFNIEHMNVYLTTGKINIDLITCGEAVK